MNDADARWTSLVAWYRGAGRSLSWRGSPDPWVVLVSEVMLQQTQVARVADRIGGFLDAFPTPEAMASSGRQRVLAVWSGLGYNRRATRLQEAAIRIAAEGWPTSAAELRDLPGVGPYTAAAVACFAFGEQTPAIDINVRRVLSRWVGRALSTREAADVANTLLPPGEAHHWSQSIMDLGASTCTARDPACFRCPCEPWCLGPDIQVVSRPQSRFRGSTREARGAIVKALSGGGRVRLGDLEENLDKARLERAAEDLAAEGLVELRGDIVTLRESLDTTSGDE